MAFHEVLGRDRQLRDEPRVCSLCCHEIPEDLVHLILWNDTGELAWVYCDGCAPLILRLVPRP